MEMSPRLDLVIAVGDGKAIASAKTVMVRKFWQSRPSMAIETIPPPAMEFSLG